MTDEPAAKKDAAPDPLAATSGKTGDSPAAGAVPTPSLSPEEQMALFEKELKEQDWGHQPC